MEEEKKEEEAREAKEKAEEEARRRFTSQRSHRSVLGGSFRLYCNELADGARPLLANLLETF